MAYYDGPCPCSSLNIGIFDTGIISPPPQTTLLADEPIKFNWEMNNTATGFSLGLMTYNGHCTKTSTTSGSQDCVFSDAIERVLDSVPDTGKAMVTLGTSLAESRADYVLVGSLWYRDYFGVTWYTYQQGFYTVLKEEDEVPIRLPTFDQISLNLTKQSSTSSSVASAQDTATPTSPATDSGVSRAFKKKCSTSSPPKADDFAFGRCDGTRPQQHQPQHSPRVLRQARQQQYPYVLA